MVYRLAADSLVVVHFGFICFVILGGLLAVRWNWVILLHLPAVVWGMLIEFYGWICPLTPWENQLREAAGQGGYEGGFVEHYLLAVMYPEGLTHNVQVVLGLIVLLMNASVYGWLIYRRKKAVLS
ncbi:MAG: DUF2784 domain-containing protein [Planctomycetaceae bacterium]|nr:DUF2784 domain-containing protein [Planctomycetaceae bacterium]